MGYKNGNLLYKLDHNAYYTNIQIITLGLVGSKSIHVLSKVSYADIHIDQKISRQNSEEEKRREQIVYKVSF